MRNRIGNAALLIGALLVTLIIAETITRSVYRDSIVLFPRYHSSAKYGEFKLRRLRPNSVFWHTSIGGSWKFVTNSQGFRDDRDWVYEKTKERIRILTVGDSHTEGFEVRQEQTYSKVIERVLNERGFDVEVFNAGISGFSTAEIVAFLENAGVRYSPDFVVYGMFANDFEDNVKAGLFTLKQGELEISSYEHLPGVRILEVINAIAPLRWLSENSYLYSFAMNTVWETAKQLLLDKSEARLATEFAISKEDVSNYKMDLMVALMRRMHAICKQHNIKLIVVDIPQLSNERIFQSSIPPNTKMIEEISSNSYSLIHSEKILSKYRQAIPLHVPDGHRHISEFTHALLGVKIADVITSSHH